MKIDWNKIKEAAKEPLRLLILAIIPVILVSLDQINAEWAGVIILVLRFIDKYLHNLAPAGEAGGLTRF